MTSSRNGIDSTDTPPLSESERKEKKAAKKARKLARRAEAAARESDGGSDKPPPGINGGMVGKTLDETKKEKKKSKRKAEETSSIDHTNAGVEINGDEKKIKKSKKDKTITKEGSNGTSDHPTTNGHTAPVTSTSDTGPAPKPSSAEAQKFLTENRISHEPVTALSELPPILSFSNLPLDDGVRKGLSSYSKPTPIQSASFPVMFGGRDVVGIAETGSGKTVAFGVPAIQHILSLPVTKQYKGAVSVLVVAPTRELAMQTHANLSAISSSLPHLTSICIYGGVSKDEQKKILKQAGPRIVVGTPGRLLDLAGEGALDLSKVSWLVLDEADRMLDKGFENDIREIIKLCLPLPQGGKSLGPIGKANSADAPVARMTCMFSATWPVSVRKLASDFMCSPIRITVGADELTANSRVEQTVQVLSDGREKEQRLLAVLRSHNFTKGGVKKGDGVGRDRGKALVFALYKKEATRVMEFLERQGFEVGCIQGDMTQDKRTRSLEDFKDGRVQILVATDVAARGLDIPKVELVVNQTFPLTIEDYIHRIGRTGRAGRKGKAVTFFTEADKAHAGELIRVLKDGGHDVPEGMFQWGTTIKKATHSTYGAHYRDDVKGTAKKIKFD